MFLLTDLASNRSRTPEAMPCAQQKARPSAACERTTTRRRFRPAGRTFTAPTVGQVDERIRADDDTLNALQQLARSQDRAVSDVVRDALSRYLAASRRSPSNGWSARF